MTQDEIIRMALEAGISSVWAEASTRQLERFAALVAAHEKKFWMEQIEVECNEAVLAEREACAKVCESLPKPTEPTILTHLPTLRTCAAAIRARGEK